MSDTQYTFSSKPQAVAANRKAKGGYREKDAPVESVNIMFDPRVYRGSTYSSHTRSKYLAQQQKAEREAQRRSDTERMKKENSLASSQGVVDNAPPPLPGRKDMDVQTDTYLEELTDRVPETDMQTQTDSFADRPSLPLFVPSKSGVDVETQVDVDELFDFDAEVEPILEVLVGKTLEHAMMEVLEEEELSSIREHQSAFEQERNVERAQVQRLEAEAVRRNEERRRRIDQEKDRMEREAQVMDKVAARAFAADFLSDLYEKNFGKGTEAAELIKEVENQFLPWLIESVQQRTSDRLLARSLTDSLVAAALSRRRAQYEARQEEIRAEQERIHQEEERRRMEQEVEEAAAAAAAAAAEGETGEGTDAEGAGEGAAGGAE